MVGSEVAVTEVWCGWEGLGGLGISQQFQWMFRNLPCYATDRQTNSKARPLLVSKIVCSLHRLILIIDLDSVYEIPYVQPR